MTCRTCGFPMWRNGDEHAEWCRESEREFYRAHQIDVSDAIDDLCIVLGTA